MSTRVLIVDDHARFRASVRRVLEAAGFTVAGEADDGESGLAAAQELRPDVVLLDLQLPDYDGFQVASELRATGMACCIVLTSSRDWSDLAALVEECGACGFIPKDELSGKRLAELVV